MKNHNFVFAVIGAGLLAWLPGAFGLDAHAADPNFKKITRAPLVAEKTQPDESHDDFAPNPDAGVIVTQPSVTSLPAPGSESAKTSDSGEQGKTPERTVAHSQAHHEPGVDPDKSLGWLVNGNARFVSRKFRTDGKSAADRIRLFTGQHPHTIVLSCADSRVPPEVVFDQALGELFTIRVAGEVLDSTVIASIEYAVEHLGTRLIVIMGHTKCGAVDTAMKTKPGTSAGSADIDHLLAEIRPHLNALQTESPSANLEVESGANADGVAQDLLKRSVIVRKKVEAGQVKIKPALYYLDSGKVTFR